MFKSIKKLFKKESLETNARDPSPSGLNWNLETSASHVKKSASIDFLENPCFEILPEVAQRFNVYAEAAFPMEIGGLLRLVWNEEKNLYQAVDIKILKQRVTPTYFEMEPAALAAFNLELVRAGRGKEISEWRCLIHSHPGMTPFMSGVDRDNLDLLAGDEWAFSVICSARENSKDNYYAVHYAQRKPLSITIQDIYLGGGDLAGKQLINQNEQNAIRQEVLGLCDSRSTMNAALPVVADKSNETNESEETSEQEESEETLYEEISQEYDLELFDSFSFEHEDRNSLSQTISLANKSKEAKGYIPAADLTESQYQVLDQALDTKIALDIYEDEILGQARAELSDWISPQSVRVILVGLTELRDDPPEHFNEDESSEVNSLIDFFAN